MDQGFYRVQTGVLDFIYPFDIVLSAKGMPYKITDMFISGSPSKNSIEAGQ